MKAKKSSHLRARDYENTMEQFEDAKSGKKKVVTEKELSKVSIAHVYQIVLFVKKNLSL